MSYNFLNILNVSILNTNTWISIIKCEGHHAFGIIHSNGGHNAFNYTHTSIKRKFNQFYENILHNKLWDVLDYSIIGGGSILLKHCFSKCKCNRFTTLTTKFKMDDDMNV